MDASGNNPKFSWLAAIIPALLLAAVFSPILGYDFINLDVPDQVINNPDIRSLSPGSLGHIFTSKNVSSYYPIRTLTLAIDYHFWGENPRGYKQTNLAIHLANTLLVFWLLLRLFPSAGADSERYGIGWNAGVAAFGAAVFAIHPVVVEPVAWVPGREELLMTLGASGCVHCHLGARRLEAEGRRGGSLACWFGAVLCGAIACLSNAVGAVVPLLITAWDVLTLERPRLWKIVRSTAILWLIAAATIAVKRSGAEGESLEAGLFTFTRALMVPKVFWLNMMEFVCPANLAIDHGKVTAQGLGEAGVVPGLLLAIAVLAALWRFRQRKAIAFGLLWLLLAMVPTAQIMPHHIHRADRFLYLPLVGLVLALVGAIRAAIKPRAAAKKERGATQADAAAPSAEAPVPTFWIGVATVCLMLLAILSFFQVRTWQDSATVWRQALKVTPGGVFAHRRLADALAESGRFNEAIPHYEWVLEHEPGNTATIANYAMRLACAHDEALRDYDRAIQLAAKGCEDTRNEDPQLRRALSTAYMNRATALAQKGRFAEAVDGYRSAIEADPEHEVPLFNLALLLATCPDENIRRPEEAVRLAEQACAAAEEPNFVQLSILATVYEQTGHKDQAADAKRRAVEAARASGELNNPARFQK